MGRFRHTPYPSVLIGTLLETDEATGEIADSSDSRSAASARDSRAILAGWYEREPALFEHVNRVTPIEVTTRFDNDDVTESLCVALEPHAVRLCGIRFYVRVNLRGLKGRVQAQACERALGSFLWEQAGAAGAAAEVGFDDADIVVAVEVVGKRAGFAFLDREARSIELIRPR